MTNWGLWIQLCSQCCIVPCPVNGVWIKQTVNSATCLINLVCWGFFQRGSLFSLFHS